ncbi:hypothetical protein MGEO_12405 [Marivita geojedonensis]|uniref:Secreted protein n=1 Tax=Marivita geojedonensis TaxID=1123756 RepID=A0A1X4NJZ3_9RHOB|nr:hypothetical protein [Marivita geojedonensis]OSQ50592.1 hypothetical protein MGEO_12405 [Marivita geojedonensis]PRY79887.1 hypothetical protein CLV76_10487 [Marivita geojedonensis]
MHRHAAILASFFVLVLALPAIANTGVVRGGEHDGFTRLTISTQDEVETVHHRLTKDGQYILDVSPRIDRLDLSLMFKRLSAGRVAGLSRKGDGLSLDLDCECDVQLKTESGRLIIIDILDVPAAAPSPSHRPVILPILPEKPALLPEPWGIRFAVKSAEEIPLDSAMVGRVSKQIAAQIGQASAIQGFFDLATGQNRDESLGHVPQPVENPAIGADNSNQCFWFDAVWSNVTQHAKGKEAGLFATLAVEALSDETSDAHQEMILSFLTNGQFAEARAAALRASLDTRHLEGLHAFLRAVLVSDSTDVALIPQCNALSDLLSAARRDLPDVTNEEKLTLARVFDELPVGFQIGLYPRVAPILDDISSALHRDLAVHRHVELELTERISTEIEIVGKNTDPDGLAALSLEMRGTELATQSWHASFSAYLSHQRFFDALEELNSTTGLTKKERKSAVGEFVDRLVEQADSITFLQIALTEVPKLRPRPEHSDLRRIEARLKVEGFVPDLKSVVDSEAAPKLKPNDTRSTEESTLSVSEVDMLHTGRQTVAVAQEQLENAQAVRQSWRARFTQQER